MSDHSSVRELKAASAAAGRPFLALLVVRRVAPKTAANGNPFLNVELGDRTGSFSCNVFSDSPAFDALKGSAEGSIARIEGKTDTYQGRFSPKLTRASIVPEAELAPGETIENLVERSPEDPEAMWTELQGFIAGIGHAELRAAVQAVFDDMGESFRSAPAAISMHHAYRHGLLEHTLRMARAARALLPLYPEIDPDLAVAGILLHDAGKTIEYEGKIAAKRSRRGVLQGHVVLGYQLVRKAGLKVKLDPDRLERLEHIILSHQGELEWGAAAMAATPEAVFVSMVDNLDARMGMVQQALRQAVEGQEFTERVPGLEAPLLTRPVGGR
ncbi:MAG: HD domain-containing protein [Opitutaceae bacterium]